MSYRTEFMISSGLNEDYITLMFAGIIAIVIGAFVFAIWRTYRRKGMKSRLFTAMRFIVVFFVGGILISGAAILSYLHIKEASELLEVYNNKQYKIAEGYVNVLHKQPYGGHDDGDMVEIGDIKFVIDYFTPTSAYDMTIAKGGFLKKGVYARVYYHRYDYDNKIIRIDIRRD